MSPVLRGGGRVPHLLFGGVLGLLSALVVWWLLFLAHAVRTEDALWDRVMQLEASSLERQVAELHLPVGAFPGHEAFEILSTDPPRVAASALTMQQRHALSDRRELMVYGEGSLLFVLLLGCVAMLYRLVLAEQRYRRDVDAFLGRVTHEMKTPLAGLKAMLQTLREGLVPPERLTEIAEMGLRQAEREEHLIENLLTAHRLGTRAASLDISDVDLCAVLAEFIPHRRRTMGSEADRIVLRTPPSLVARANTGALMTILENLADNAFKYGATNLVLEAVAEDGGVRLSACDDGQGFDASEAEELFRPFRRGEDPRAAGRHGSGLGLPISRALAAEMGGSLRARSDGRGRGASFDLRLLAPQRSAA